MINNFILTEILYGIVWGVAILVLREFILSRDGMLRKIMIAYFSVEIFTYVSAAIYFCGIQYHWVVIPLGTFRLLLIIPKVGVKLWFLWYLKVKRAKNKEETSHIPDKNHIFK